MEAGFLTMSSKELDRLEVLQRVCERGLKQVEAAGILRITPRQLRRLVERFKQGGAAGLISCSRGKPSNNRLPEALSRDFKSPPWRLRTLLRHSSWPTTTGAFATPHVQSTTLIGRCWLRRISRTSCDYSLKTDMASGDRYFAV